MAIYITPVSKDIQFQYLGVEGIEKWLSVIKVLIKDENLPLFSLYLIILTAKAFQRNLLYLATGPLVTVKPKFLDNYFFHEPIFLLEQILII